MSDLKAENVLRSVKIVIEQHNNERIKQVEDYNGGSVSLKVSRIIHSYTDYINRTVWREYN